MAGTWLLVTRRREAWMDAECGRDVVEERLTPGLEKQVIPWQNSSPKRA
jgi:hypothetical protein